MVEQLCLPMHQMHPCVLRAVFFDGYPAYELRKAQGVDARQMGLGANGREVYDYEIEYYLRSEGGIMIDGRYVPMYAGDVNIRKPGQCVRGVAPYQCFLICFDVTGNSERTQPYLFGSKEQAQPQYKNPILDALPERISCPNGSGIEALFMRACRLRNEDGPASILHRNMLLMQILSLLTDMVLPQTRRVSPGIRRAADEIERRFNEEISVDGLIAQSGMSKATFHRRFRAEMGCTPLEMMTRMRIERAKDLLVRTDETVANIAQLCGYTDNAYFTRAFRKHCGMTPGTFREGK